MTLWNNISAEFEVVSTCDVYGNKPIPVVLGYIVDYSDGHTAVFDSHNMLVRSFPNGCSRRRAILELEDEFFIRYVHIVRINN